MLFYTNIPELLKRLAALKAAVAPAANGDDGGGGIQDALVAALNSGRGLMKRRIFNEGMDAEGKPLGNYRGSKTNITARRSRVKKFGFEEKNKERSKARKNLNKAADGRYTEYEKERIGAGRQIDKKDLQFSGSLNASIETVKAEGGKVVIQISNTENARIARYQEQQIGNIRAGQNAVKGKAEPAKIFLLSQAEFDEVETQGKRLIADVIKNRMNG